MADNPAGADAELIALSEWFNRMLETVNSMDSEDIKDWDTFNALVGVTGDLAHAMALMRATTLVGLRAKAQALIYACECEEVDIRNSKILADIMPASIARDLLAIELPNTVLSGA
jgi:hypothetical protein